MFFLHTTFRKIHFCVFLFKATVASFSFVVFLLKLSFLFSSIFCQFPPAGTNSFDIWR
ncbi:unnamed protein product [Meloidogyne enterolobii]|uniref:Uncharacterized protein n=2 Tax=Meloidogyne enterolobii TaxID=390850 RepID=A0ACB1AM87_MELEN|nr:unnamed protein product [Meloidogyne enterolobii]